MPPFSFSCELGGPIASLLGTGVMFRTADFLNAGFFTEAGVFAIAFTPFGSELAFHAPVEELGVPLGVPLGALEKKLRMEAFFEELELFFNDGGTGVVWLSFFTMMPVTEV